MFILLVGTPSCLNPKIGEKIECVLSLGLDAHVQGILSFALEKTNFVTAEDFTALKEAVRADRKIEHIFDGERALAVFRFQDADGRLRSVIASNLIQCYLRRTIRLGVTAEGANSIKLERPYEQVHVAAELMKEQLNAIVTDLKRDLNAADGPATIARTRNPGAAYSDSTNDHIHHGSFDTE